MLPAIGQGAIGIECRVGDDRTEALLAPLNHPASSACVAAERALLAALDGSCRTPIAALAEIGTGGGLALRGAVVTPDGAERLDVARRGAAGDAARMGHDAGEELRRRAGPAFLAAIGG
jgi:hydroxymethylbilane synthase